MVQSSPCGVVQLSKRDLQTVSCNHASRGVVRLLLATVYLALHCAKCMSVNAQGDTAGNSCSGVLQWSVAVQCGSVAVWQCGSVAVESVE